jgi:hypothetical protein
MLLTYMCCPQRQEADRKTRLADKRAPCKRVPSFFYRKPAHEPGVKRAGPVSPRPPRTARRSVPTGSGLGNQRNLRIKLPHRLFPLRGRRGDTGGTHVWSAVTRAALRAGRGTAFGAYTTAEKFLDYTRASGTREGQASACPWTSRRSSLPVCGTARLVHILFGSGMMWPVYVKSGVARDTACRRTPKRRRQDAATIRQVRASLPELPARPTLAPS